jgi:hypothetical protein
MSVHSLPYNYLSSINVSPLTAQLDADPFGDFFGSASNDHNTSSTSTNPWNAADHTQKSDLATQPPKQQQQQQQQQQQHSSFAQAASQRKTPESFLGDSASLVNLENLIPARPKSTNPFGATQPQLSAAHAMSASNSSGHLNNPFLAQQALHNQSKPTISQLQSQQKQSLQTTAFPSFGQQPTTTTSNRDG